MGLCNAQEADYWLKATLCVFRYSSFVKSSKPCNVTAAGDFAFTNEERLTTNNEGRRFSIMPAGSCG
jgi:hypothetical protein